MPITGSCRCGAVKYELSVEGLPLTYACHCLDCQTWSGSAFALHALLPESLVKLSGNASEFELENVESMASQHIVCATCSTRIANRNAAVPNMIILRAGTLTRSDELVPAIHIWTKRKQSWIKLPESVRTFDETPSPQEFGAALQG
ncbi:GFA family protein [Sphingomonas sp. MMS24-J13]|uniref:GFA family protein n=1 Tax=Sphingomonas sp. MMS24-J13 TaxID=3238686 RepID=UPI00384A8B90